MPRGNRIDSAAARSARCVLPDTRRYCDEEMNFYKASGLRGRAPDDEKAEQDEDRRTSSSARLTSSSCAR